MLGAAGPADFGEGLEAGGGDRASGPLLLLWPGVTKTFYFLLADNTQQSLTLEMHAACDRLHGMTFHSLPYEPRPLTATEARLEAIYNAARMGLKGDSLALASGMTPTEYRRLCQMDPIAEYAEQKGRADGEMAMATVLNDAALQGDAKAALEVLKYAHKWSAPQSIQVQVEQKISIIAALEQAQQRVLELTATDAIDCSTNSMHTPSTKEYADDNSS